MEEIFLRMAGALAREMGLGRIEPIQIEPMGADEQGYSGAKLSRLRFLMPDGTRRSFVLKYAGPMERLAMDLLTRQGRGHTPHAHQQPPLDREGWFIMQDIGPNRWTPQGPDWKRKVAGALAEIHRDNLGFADRFPQACQAGEAHWRDVVGRLSVDHFERQCQSDNAFSARYAHLMPKLRRRGEIFARNMIQLCREGNSLTLTHGDLQTMDGDHVRCLAGRPMIIDWGFSRYAPFYIDLVDYFTLEEAEWYRLALCQGGVELGQGDFEERWRMAAPYPGFIYLYPALMAHRRGDEALLERRLARILAE